MAGGLDLASLYSQSGPALLGVLNVMLAVVWYDVRKKVSGVEETADEAAAEAGAAKEAAQSAREKNSRQEVLLDQVAGDVEDVEEATERNDQRIRRIQQSQAASQGDDFFRGASRNETSSASTERD